MSLSIDLKNSVHIFLAYKGGVGKTTTAALFAEWVIAQGVKPVVFDADVKNHTSCISNYKALEAHRLSENLLQTEGGTQVVTGVGFAPILDSIFESDAPHLVDIGANAYVQFLSFMAEMNFRELLEENGKTLYVHAVVAGGEMTAESASGAQELVDLMPGAKMILWLNQPHAEARMPGGELYKNSKEFAKIMPSLSGMVPMNKMSDIMRNAHSTLAPLHLLSTEIVVDKLTGSLMRSLSYKSWARQAFSALDAIFQAK